MKRLFFIMLLAGVTFLQSAASGKYELKTSLASLTVDKKGNLQILQDKGEEVRVVTPLNHLWKIVVKNSQNNREFTLTPGKDMLVNKEEGMLRLSVDGMDAGNQRIDLKAEFRISVKEDAFCFSGSVESPAGEWLIREVVYPSLTGIGVNGGNAGIYWPAGLGEYYGDPAAFEGSSKWYPASQQVSMPWFSINYNGGGLYVGNHDKKQENKQMGLSYDKASRLFSAEFNNPVYESSYVCPDVMVWPYSGGWYEASKYYRKWYNRHFVIVPPPQWVKDDSGWLLAIMKQQNMEVMWNYKDIDKLCDVADQFNLRTIGLFGWTIGGHDHLYPNYHPCPLMGGREELKKAIERAHKRGKKIILYANGKIMDTSTDFFRYNGYETMVIQENRQPQIQYYIKQKNATPVIFAQGCTGSEIWRKTMFDLGMQAVSLGADGILYDQMGVMTPYLCYAKNHDHVPGMSDTHNRQQMIREIREAAKKINPEFIIMTEATNDAIIKEIEYHHGWGIGTAPGNKAFPELFMYTYPELMETQRNPNPMITRTDANFAAVMGLRHEIETRYAGDVEYLLKGKLPKPEDYANVASPPNLEKMNLLPAREATAYVHTLIGFENQYPEFFRHGKFIALDGIVVQGTDIKANGFQKGNKIGVVVWNQNLSEKREFSVSVPGYRLAKAAEPGKNSVNDSAPLDANSLRLLVYEKN